MFIIKIEGGLGNQLFQYSLGRLLEIKYNKIVSYDFSSYEEGYKYTPRKFLLDKFNTKLRVATKDEIYKTLYPFGVVSKCVHFFKKVINKFIFKKYHVAFEPTLLSELNKLNTAYLGGYWQSYKYVLPVIEQLGNECTLVDDSSLVTNSNYQLALSTESVAVHIRRGDYVGNSKDLQPLEKTYYENAVKVISEKIENPKFFIFSDDISWVKSNMSDIFDESTVYIEGRDLKDYEELLLISTCKHSIIANSTFSWWGAMLNKNTHKVIISPKNWKNIHFKDDSDLCPMEWVRA